MKFIEKIRNKHVEIFMILFAIYLIGAVSDGFGFFNWLVNVVGIILQVAILPFILINHVVLFDSGLLPARRSVIINMSVIFVCLICTIVCWKLKMATFLFTSGTIILFNFIMLIFSIYRLTRVYMEVVNDEKKENNINTPRASIVEFFNNF